MPNTFPTTKNDWDDGEIIESDWADALETKIGADNSSDTTSHDYKIRALEAQVWEEQLTRISSTVYTLAFKPITTKVRIMIGGTRVIQGLDYTLGGTNNQTVTFAQDIDSGALVYADYTKSLS